MVHCFLQATCVCRRHCRKLQGIPTKEGCDKTLWLPQARLKWECLVGSFTRTDPFRLNLRGWNMVTCRFLKNIWCKWHIKYNSPLTWFRSFLLMVGFGIKNFHKCFWWYVHLRCTLGDVKIKLKDIAHDSTLHQVESSTDMWLNTSKWGACRQTYFQLC